MVEVRKQSSAPLRLDGARVLVLFGGIPLWGQERGNIEVFRQMAGLGLQAKFITHRRWGHLHVQPELERHGFAWTTAPFGPRIGKNFFNADFVGIVWGIIATNFVLLREVLRWRPTHLHVMNWQYMLYASPLFFLLRTPLIYRLGDAPPRHGTFHRRLWKWISCRARRIVCVSNFIRDDAIRAGSSAEKLVVIHSTPPARAVAKSEADKFSRPSPNSVALAFVGQISESKGVPVLVEAARKLLSSGRDVVVWLAGDYSWQNPMAEKLIAEIKRDKLENRIRFLGHVEDVHGLLSRADIHAFPSLQPEGLPNVVLEAKRAGIPSVVFPAGGAPELIGHKTDGWICDASNAESLVKGADYFLDNAEARKRAGLAARESVEKRFGVERFKQQWTQVFLTNESSG